MRTPISLSLTLLALVTRVTAHGWIGLLRVDGTLYAGPASRENGAPPLAGSPIWQVGSQGPVLDLNAPDMACGNGADTPAAALAAARPGSNITLQWTNGDGGRWMHPWGSMQTYLARCTGAGGCAAADPTTLDWFKISAIGQSKPHANAWYMAELRKCRSCVLWHPK
jgi:hypothetical protein